MATSEGDSGTRVAVLASGQGSTFAALAAASRSFSGRIINTHPAPLPRFGGKGMYGEHVHRAVLAYGAKVSGCTVHFVDEEYDTGPIIAQRAVEVADDDTPATLAARILPHEHAALVETLEWLAEGRLCVEGRRVRVRPPAGSAGRVDSVSAGCL